MLQEQVRRPLIFVASFYVAAIGFQQERFLPTPKPQRDMPIAIYYL